MSSANSRWVFLRGLTRESRHWGDFPAIFRGAIPDAETYAIDLPGNGCLNDMESPCSVEQMAEHCRAELGRRGLAPPWHLLAMSLGAMVAVAWAARYPEEIGGCVLINTSLRPLNPFHRRLKPGNYPTLLGMALPGRTAAAQEESVLRLTSRRAEATAHILRAWTAYRTERPVSRRNALRQLLAAARYSAPRRKPATRLLLLASAGDALVDSRCTLEIAHCWQSAVAVHPDAGHDLPLDDGPWVASQVRDWLRAEAGAEVLADRVLQRTQGT